MAIHRADAHIYTLLGPYTDDYISRMAPDRNFEHLHHNSVA